MSRAYKDALIQELNNLNGTQDNDEAMSGADMARAILVARNTNNGSSPDFGAGYLGENLAASVAAVVTADGVNTVTVDSVKNLRVGQVVSISTTSGIRRAADRTITAINGLVVTYDGADASGTIAAGNVVVREPGVNNDALSGADLEKFQLYI